MPKSEAVQLAKINRQAQTQRNIVALISNPALEFIAGMYAIEHMFPEGQKTTTIKTSPSFWGNPLWVFQQMTGQNTSTTSTITETTSTQEQWAKNALMWIIIAQQLAPVAPQLIDSAGNVISGVSGALGGLLKAGIK